MAAVKVKKLFFLDYIFTFITLFFSFTVEFL